MTEAPSVTNEERLARLAARRGSPTSSEAEPSHAAPGAQPAQRPARRRPAEASRWLVAAGSAAAGFGMVAGFAVAAGGGSTSAAPAPLPTPQGFAAAAQPAAQPIIVINTGAPITQQQAQSIAMTAQSQLPAETSPQPVQQMAAQVQPVAETAGS